MDGIPTILLAGGAGGRLNPLTREQAKPALPLGGIYRPIDITLSNGIDSGLMRTYIPAQHKALTLNRHVRQAGRFLPPEADRERGRCVTESGIAGLHGGSPGLQKRNTRALHPAASPTSAGTNGDHEFAKALSPGS